MRYRNPVILGLAALVILGACSSEPSPPANVSAYRPAPDTGYGSPDGGGAVADPYGRAQQPNPAGGIRWHHRLADAQAEARSTGKLILALSTKPRCGLCDKFKTLTAPAAAFELNRIAVGYIYDITRPEVRQVDMALRANLKGADLMPLVGFLTPELGWVHGFWGSRSVNQFRGDIARASSIHPVRSARVTSPAREPAARLATVVNEFGEPEWSPPGDVWPVQDPEPIDAITGAPDLPADRPSAITDPAAAPVMADAGDVSGAGEGTPAVAPPAPLPTLRPSRAEAEAIAPAPAKESPEDDQAWGRRTLERALSDIEAGRYDEARGSLDEVRARLPGTTLAREASKGCVALYNAKRIRLATNGLERDRYLSRARRDLGNSMWGVLFSS